jgi:hypothetical protein
MEPQVLRHLNLAFFNAAQIIAHIRYYEIEEDPIASDRRAEEAEQSKET